jgi:hypothetical protein
MSNLLTRPSAEILRLLLRPREAAEALGISERLLFDLNRSGQIPCLRIPGRGKARSIRYAVADLQAFINRTKAETGALKPRTDP